MVSRARPIAVLIVAALAVAGCGDDDDDRGNVNVEGGTDTGGSAETTGTTGTTPEEPTQMPIATIRVRETDFELSPKNPRIAKTGVVAFRVTNAGDATHALEVEGPEGERETEALEPGGSATLRVDLSKAGRYKWYCPISDHESRGMKGVIIVAGGGSGAASDDKGGRRSGNDDDTGTSTSGGSGSSGSSGRGGGEDDSGGTGGGVSGY